MAITATWNELLQRNRIYAETKHEPQPYVEEVKEIPPPSFLIYTCIDFRVATEESLGIKSEDAFVVRCAGGRPSTNINDLLFVDTFTQEKAVKEVIVIHHTDCGYTHTDDNGIRTAMKAKMPPLADQIDQLHFGTYGSSERLAESIREDLQFLKGHPLLRQSLKDSAKGYIYDIKAGRLTHVDPDN